MGAGIVARPAQVSIWGLKTSLTVLGPVPGRFVLRYVDFPDYLRESLPFDLLHKYYENVTFFVALKFSYLGVVSLHAAL